ncbi:hypothetical protein ACFL24_02235 [Patescibacteria group bacterium]
MENGQLIFTDLRNLVRSTIGPRPTDLKESERYNAELDGTVTQLLEVVEGRFQNKFSLFREHLQVLGWLMRLSKEHSIFDTKGLVQHFRNKPFKKGESTKCQLEFYYSKRLGGKGSFSSEIVLEMFRILIVLRSS